MISIDKDLILPNSLREELKKPFGEIVECPNVPTLVKPGDKIIAVGDSVSASLINAGLFPTLIIWDGRTQRKPVGEATLRVLRKYAPIKKARNPAGMIAREAWTAVTEALNKERTSLFVDGEEDLLAIPAILNSEEGTMVVYGSPPGQGAILIVIDRKIKSAFQEILSKFEKSRK